MNLSIRLSPENSVTTAPHPTARVTQERPAANPSRRPRKTTPVTGLAPDTRTLWGPEEHLGLATSQKPRLPGLSTNTDYTQQIVCSYLQPSKLGRLLKPARGCPPLLVSGSLSLSLRTLVAPFS
ncbi:hypothetical protein EYF80_030483 [Liparis tanakae]|uniref:Uncharacterized protein n=1 Tax=Liparis tanakae TaxID=230148 RepID=A0A4Z2H0L4_9TELE|nr:hypothetical protein EYF80_030483 [Liparis tanakae]